MCPNLVLNFLELLHLIHGSIHLNQATWASSRKGTPKHQVPSNMFQSGDGVLGIVDLSFLPPNVRNIHMAKLLNLFLSVHKIFEKIDSGTSTCILSDFRRAARCFWCDKESSLVFVFSDHSHAECMPWCIHTR